MQFKFVFYPKGMKTIQTISPLFFDVIPLNTADSIFNAR